MDLLFAPLLFLGLPPGGIAIAVALVIAAPILIVVALMRWSERL